MTELGWEQVRAWRVRRHALAERAPAGDTLEVVSRLCESLREKLGQGFGAYLKPAAFRGRLCFGPSDGQLVRFTRPDAWLGHAIERPEPDQALREIARRYLAAHGPATREDLRRWWATTPAAAGRLLRSLEDAEEVSVDGEPLWMLAVDAAEAASLPPRLGPYLGGDLAFSFAG